MDEATKKLSGALSKITEKLVGWLEAIIVALPNIIIACLIVFIFWLLSKWVHRVVRRLLKKTHLNESLEILLANIVKIVVILLGFVLALSVLELQKVVFSMLAGVGVLGLALGFAFQDLAANFVSGILIALRAPMKIGEVVEIRDIQGTVEEIRLRDTLIRNFDGQDVFIPNKDFMKEDFTNYSSFGKRKVKIAVGVDYTADLDKVKKLILEAIDKLDDTLQDPEPAVYVDALGGSSVNLTASVWIKYPGKNYLQVKHDATVKIKEALDAEKINMPYPTRTLALRPEIESLLSKGLEKST